MDGKAKEANERIPQESNARRIKAFQHTAVLSSMEPVPRNGLSLTRNGHFLSEASIPGSTVLACYFALRYPVLKFKSSTNDQHEQENLLRIFPSRSFCVW